MNQLINRATGNTVRLLVTTALAMLAIGNVSAQTVQYGYDAQGRLSTVTQSDGTTQTYLYENASFPNAMTGLIDENGVRFSTWNYDAQGRAIGTYEAGNAGNHTLVYNTDGSVTVTDALGAVRTFTFGRYGDRNLVTGISGSQCPTCAEPKATTYDLQGYLASRTDYNNNVTKYTYDDSRGLETSRTEAYNTAQARTTTTSWHATFRLPLLISVYNGNTATGTPIKTTSFTYDGSGNQLTKTITDPAASTSRTWTYTYNNFGQVLTVDGPRTDINDITTYTYYNCNTGYECGQVATITNAAGQTTTFNTYNATGQPLTITDPNGVQTTLTYDARQRLTSRSVGGELTSFEYWPTGLLKKVALPDGSYLSYTYDNAHRLTQIQDAEGNKVVYTLDLAGNHTAENLYDPLGALARTHSSVFNSLSQLNKDLTAAGTVAQTTTFGYDNNGNQTTIAAPLTRNTSNQYDALNRLKQVTDPNNGTTKYGYDANDNLTSAIDPRNLNTSYTYNGLGDLTQQQSPDTGTTINTYDSAGNLKTSKDANNSTVTYSYDQLNRVTQASYSDQTINYTYDQGANGVGHLTSLSDASGNTSYSYTGQGRINSKTQTTDSITKSLMYGYNAAGQLTQLTTPSGNNITYTYSNGKLASLSVNGNALIGSIAYDPFGPIKQWTWGNGAQTTRTYDQDGKLTSINTVNANTYSFDDAFRITGNTDNSNSTLSWTYGYDSLDRLNNASKTGTTQTFTFDANGNRLTQGGTTSLTFTNLTTSNKLNSISGAQSRTYSYDNVGHTLSDGSRTFTYNAAGRLITATSGGITTTYTYNALGQRVKKSNSNGTTYFVYDEAGHELGEYDQAGNIIQELVWLGDIPVATIRTDQSGGSVGVFYIHTDHLNAPSKITRPSDNAIIWRWDHDPYGNGTPNQDPDGNGLLLVFNLRFPGQYFDAETNLYYNWNRYYDQSTGRYISSDPIGLDGGLNTYAYAGSSPTMLTDPTGLDVYRGPGNYYSDIPPAGACERAVFSGDYIVAWVTCPQEMPQAPPRQRYDDNNGYCDASDAEDFDWFKWAWDTLGPDWTWLIPEAKAGKIFAAMMAAKKFSKEKQALVDMAKLDKKFGITRADMAAYSDLNRGLPDPFPSNKIRLDEGHLRGAPHSQVPHGHVGPIDHIPITDP